MALKSQESYLHLITGGYDNSKRREVRKLFAVAPESKVEDVAVEKNLDLIVGLLEEFYAIGVKEFSLQQAKKTLEIFGIIFDENAKRLEILRGMLNSPRMRLHVNKDIWAVPDEKHIENLRVQFCDCSEEAIAKRFAEIKELQKG